MSLLDGKTLSGWNVPKGDNGHWKVTEGVIDYDAESEAPGDKNLWSEKQYGDFILQVDWRIKETPYVNARVPIIRPDGTHKKDVHGKEIRTSVPDSDSGILLRGQGKSQVNIWCWPIGSGEVYGYRMDRSMPPEGMRSESWCLPSTLDLENEDENDGDERDDTGDADCEQAVGEVLSVGIRRFDVVFFVGHGLGFSELERLDREISLQLSRAVLVESERATSRGSECAR